MRIAFIYPATEFDKQYHAEALPIGLLYLTSVLEQRHGVEVDIFDERHGPAVPDESRIGDYDIIGFTAMSMQITKALHLAQGVRERGYEGPIVFGGAHASVAADHLRAQSFIDAIFIGEAEETFPQYVAMLRGNGDAPERSWIRGRDGEWEHHPGSCFIGDLDSLPFPDRDKYGDLTRRLRFINMTTTRGCPFQCNYCQPTKKILFGRKVRRRSVDNILAEIKDAISRYEITSFSIDDDTFTFDERVVLEFSQHVKSLGLQWSCQTRSDISRETLIAMRESGCHMLTVGAESGSQRVLDLMNKSNSVEKNIAFIQTCQDLGITTWCNMMIGYPGETEEDMRQSLEFVRAARPNRVCVSQVTPFPGTHLWERSGEDVIERSWDDMARHIQRPKFRSMAPKQHLLAYYISMMNREMDQPLLSDLIPPDSRRAALMRRSPLLLRILKRRHAAFQHQLDSALKLARAGQVDSAIRALRQLHRRHPRQADILGHLAWLLMLKNRFAEAAAVYRRLVQQNPKDANAHFMLGKALAASGEPAEAARTFEETVRLAPDHVEAAEALQDLKPVSAD